MADALATQGVTADWEVGHGDDPAEVIVDFVLSRPSSIVALASRRRHPLERLRASSVTVGVARAATCPVICVAPPPD
jgi:nucleotide-binding universal stress UspA family protein